MRWLLLLAACGSAPAPRAPATEPREPPPPGIRDSRGAPLAQIATTPTSKLNPCFAGGMPITATAMWKTLQRYADFFQYGGDVAPPPARYGSCTVGYDYRNHQMAVTSAAGDVVAALGCGVLIYAPGIVDPYGQQVGRDGGAVLSHRSLRHLTCMQDGPTKVRCQFWREDEKTRIPVALEPAWYTVAGRIDELPSVEADMELTGEEAWKFFATHTLVEILANVRCAGPRINQP